jgi:hypothetical protein
MKVRVFGLAAGVRLERRWTLLAGLGDGPEIPSLALPLIVARLASGEVGAGACDAGDRLALEDFEPAFARLAIRHEALEIEQPLPLYARILGPGFLLLPSAVREMHSVLRDDGAHGVAVATCGKGIARFLARLFGFPPPGDHGLHVAFDERDGREIWTRDFSGVRFASELSQKGDRLVERFGPLRFGFRLPAGPGGLAMVLDRWWLGPMRMPLRMAPRIAAREWQEQGTFQFDVAVGLPWLGPLLAYRGWLVRADRLRPLDEASTPI